MFSCFPGCQQGFDGDQCLWSKEFIHLRDCMRLLWEQHVYWTRMVIWGIVYDLPNLEPTTNRLLRNATDFGRVFSQFYGAEIGNEFQCLIRDHLVIAAELVKAAKAGNKKAAASAERRWYANADEIVCFLHHINSYWTVGQMREMWYTHLVLTKREAVDEISKNYSGSIQTFDQIEAEALMMADSFSNGIACQFGL